MRIVKQSYAAFKVRTSNKIGDKPFLVINQTTDKIQSGWDNLVDARKTARDLNRSLNHRVF